MRACAFWAVLTGPLVWIVTIEEFEVVALAALVCFWGQNLAMCPHWLHWKQSPLWILCHLSSSIMVALALVCLMSMAFGLRLLSAFLHCMQVAPPHRSPPLTLSLRKMYSCWWVCATWVQLFHVMGWSNLMQFDTNLYGSPCWKTSRVASLLRLYPAFLAIDENWDMYVSRLSPFIFRSLIFCWALTFSAVSVKAWQKWGLGLLWPGEPTDSCIMSNLRYQLLEVSLKTSFHMIGSLTLELMSIVVSNQ